jgi:hypothetical protein
MNQKKSKKSLVKKIAKWFFGIFAVLLLLLILSPYLFKDKIKEIVVNSINKNVNADVALEDLELSFLKSFPLAHVDLKGLDVINKAPFEGDTLFHADELTLKMKLTELFKGSDNPMKIQSFSVNHGKVNVLFNKDGQANYDIAMEKETTENTSSDSESGSLSLDIQQYSCTDLDFVYFDASSKMKLSVDDIEHSGSGNFAASILDLNTQTQAKVSFEIDSINYMDNLNVALNAIIGIDLNENKYSFKENKALINQLPLEFEGFIQLEGEELDQFYNLKFHTPNSSFKNLLGVIPKQYSGNLENVKTEGTFDLDGKLVGVLRDSIVPKFGISFNSRNAKFQYPDLPKSVENINTDVTITNGTGNLNDTYINIDRLSFTIDQDVFDTNGKIYNVIENPKVFFSARGTINLDNVSKAYPIPIEQQLSGILKADLSAEFDMESAEKGRYQNIQNSGTMRLDRFVYQGEDVANPFYITESEVSFDTNNIRLVTFKAKTGATDVSLEGKLDNFYGFLFNEEVLKGDFKLASNQLNVNDFMTATTKTEETTETSTQETIPSEALKIPAFLDCTFKANAKKVTYDNVEFRNASGTLKVKDETVLLEKFQMNAFNGSIAMEGAISTQDSIADFNMNLKLQNLDIKESFTQLTTLNKIAPIANVVGGKMKSDFKIGGNLSDDMTPNIETISGDLLGELFNTKLNASDSKLLSFVGNEIKFIDVNKLNLEKVKTYITFEDGKVVLKPFTMKYEDINIQVEGAHGFDQSMNYNLTFDVPAKYLGKEVTNLLAKFSPKDRAKVGSVPVTAKLTGSFTNPKVQTDLKQATTNLVKQLIDQQKNKLLNKGSDKLLNLLGKDKDSTKTKKAGDLLNGLFKKKKKKNN